MDSDGDDRDAEADPQIASLEVSDALRAPCLRAAVDALALPRGSRGVDVGCGIGLQAALLAEAVGPRGGVTGVDIAPGLLNYARRRVGAMACAERVAFREGTMSALPFDDGALDWAWSADCVGYPAGDTLAALREMARVVRPGGTVAVLAWTSQQVLPGHALLEARLNATCSPYAPHLEGRRPEAHFLRALGWFPAAGLADAGARTFVGDVRGPVRGALRAAMLALFEMLWAQPTPAALEADRAALRRLCTEGSPGCILDERGYYGFFTYTMFHARVGDGRA